MELRNDYSYTSSVFHDDFKSNLYIIFCIIISLSTEVKTFQLTKLFSDDTGYLTLNCWYIIIYHSFPLVNIVLKGKLFIYYLYCKHYYH